MPDPISPMPAIALERQDHEAKPRKSNAPTVWEQVSGVYTEPVALFQRLAKTPRWGEALWVMIVVGLVMMTAWALKADVEAMQRPILEQNGQLTASQIDQAISISRRFILPMAFFSVMIRNLFGALAMGLVFWLFAATTDEKNKPTFLHAVSAATIPNLVLIPYTLMIGIVCLLKQVGGQIPERLAPSGLAYYLHPQNAKLYGFLAQVDPFIIAYYVMIFFAVRHLMRLKSSDAALCTTLAVLLTVGWKVYSWV